MTVTPDRQKELQDQAMARYLREIYDDHPNPPSTAFWVVTIILVVVLSLLFGALSP
jgi:hypothetical protein